MVSIAYCLQPLCSTRVYYDRIHCVRLVLNPNSVRSVTWCEKLQFPIPLGYSIYGTNHFLYTFSTRIEELQMDSFSNYLRTFIKYNFAPFFIQIIQILYHT